MQATLNLHPTRLAVITALVGAVTLAACDRVDERTPGEKLDGAISEVKKTSEEVKVEAGQAVDRTQDSLKRAADATSTAMSDASISTKVKTALAVDDKLKASKIDVDTQSGYVTLSGEAPDASSLQRATTLANAVDGVKGVTNRLMVAKHG